MNHTCKVCGEPAAGFHFGAFTCEGCKSFFGRSYNNLTSISECKNNGNCIIDKKNRTTCKACRLRKCYTVGMSKGGSRYGRRSNWFKIHCLLQEQQQQAVEAAGKANSGTGGVNGFSDMAVAAAAAAAAQHHIQQRSSHMVPPQHIGVGGLLTYPSYLPDIMISATNTRHPAETTPPSLPYFSMMNSLPSINSPQSAFLPPHLLFQGYHQVGEMVSSDITYHSEMFKHRKSVDSAVSVESQRLSPIARSIFESEDDRAPSAPSVRSFANSDHPHSHYSISPVSPQSDRQSLINICVSPKSTLSYTSTDLNNETCSYSHSPEPQTLTPSLGSAQPVFHSDTQKLESLSKSSKAGPDTTNTNHFANNEESVKENFVANDQDSPMDLSMKTTRSSIHSSCTNSTREQDMHSDYSEDLRQAMRRKFYNLSSEHESDSSSDTSSEAAKRQKIDSGASAQGYSDFVNTTTSLRGIFVCV